MMMIFTSVDLVDECASNNGGCEDICTDTDDSFVCSCSSGSTLNNNGRTCDGTLLSTDIRQLSVCLTLIHIPYNYC